MRKLGRFGAALMVAAVLTFSVTVPTMSVVRADTATTTAPASQLCDRLNALISWLESQPSGYLRDLLLRAARAACASYHCPSCS